MSDIPSFPYELLWHEREIVSVANLTRADGEALPDAMKPLLRRKLADLSGELAKNAKAYTGAHVS